MTAYKDQIEAFFRENISAVLEASVLLQFNIQSLTKHFLFLICFHVIDIFIFIYFFSPPKTSKLEIRKTGDNPHSYMYHHFWWGTRKVLVCSFHQPNTQFCSCVNAQAYTDMKSPSSLICSRRLQALKISCCILHCNKTLTNISQHNKKRDE